MKKTIHRWVARVLTLAVVLSTSLTAAAQSGSQQLVVWLKNGQKVVHDLNDKPETRFNAGYLMLTTTTVSISYPLTDVLRYTYEGYIPVVGIPSLKPGVIRYQQGADEMRFDGLAAGTPLEVYTTDGKLVLKQKAASGQTAVISLKNQPAGLYVVKVNDATYKFMKK